MIVEPEVLAARLKVLGCPYAATDPRTTAWLEERIRHAKALNIELPGIGS